MKTLLTIAALALGIAAPSGLLAHPAETVAAAPAVGAGVRIVRLSQAIGDVQMDRDTGHGYEVAFTNLPVVQGARLRTGKGVAEIEFEDNSSLRLTPNTVVEFPILSSDASGSRVSIVHVVQGEIYASMNRSADNRVSLTFGSQTLALGPAAHLRLVVVGPQPRVDVMGGTVQASDAAGVMEVGRKKALLYDAAAMQPPTLIDKVEKGEYSEWDKQETEYHSHRMPSGGRYAVSPHAYGLPDMNYYGGFTRMGSCGMLWRPYMASADWSPYSNGVWAWYRNAGYSWVSPYPWGWTAFHSGNWINCPGSGWGWQPSAQWTGLANQLLMKRVGRVQPPPHNPRPIGPTLVEVNTRPLVASGVSQDTFIFRRNSAGLGVPRSTFGHLAAISSGVLRQGAVVRPTYTPGTQIFRAGSAHGPVIQSGYAAHTATVAVRSIAASAPVSSGFSGGGVHGGPAMAGGGASSGGGHH